jgi:hypothetical protein
MSRNSIGTAQIADGELMEIATASEERIVKSISEQIRNQRG